MAPFPVQKGSMIASNLMQQTNNVNDGAPTVIPQARAEQHLSSIQLQKNVVQPQAATAHEYKKAHHLKEQSNPMQTLFLQKPES